MRFPSLTPLVKKMLMVFLAIFVIELLLQNWGGLPLFEVLALSPTRIGFWTPWQLVTYVFVAPPSANSVFSILLGLVFMWWIVSPFDERFGPRRTLQLSAACTLAASLPALLTGIIMAPGGIDLALPGEGIGPGGALRWTQRMQPMLYGFSPLITGAIAAYAYSLPPRIQISFFGILPMTPRQLIWLIVGIPVLYFLASGNPVDLIAQLGAVGGGILFVRWMRRPPPKPRPGPKRSRGGSGLHVIQGGEEDKPRWLN